MQELQVYDYQTVRICANVYTSYKFIYSIMQGAFTNKIFRAYVGTADAQTGVQALTDECTITKVTCAYCKIYIHIYICIYIYIYILRRADSHRPVHNYKGTLCLLQPTHIHMCVYIYTHMYICIYVYVNTKVHVHELLLRISCMNVTYMRTYTPLRIQHVYEAYICTYIHMLACIPAYVYACMFYVKIDQKISHNTRRHVP